MPRSPLFGEIKAGPCPTCRGHTYHRVDNGRCVICDTVVGPLPAHTFAAPSPRARWWEIALTALYIAIMAAPLLFTLWLAVTSAAALWGSK